MNQTATDWESETVSFTDLIENMSPNDLSGSDISNFTNVLEILKYLGWIRMLWELCCLMFIKQLL